MSKHTLQELQQWQALPLNIKVLMTKDRIRQWINTYGEEGVYVSFSGGKDSTVLLHLVREDYPTIPAVYVDTGLEYPEIREFVKTFDNVAWLKPRMNFKEVIKKYGYPVVSKEISQMVYECQYAKEKGKPIPKYREEKLLGTYIDKQTGELSHFNAKKWGFLLNAPFKISHKCCAIMKKDPARRYEKESGRKRITGMTASESRLRTQQWLRHGCNAYDVKDPISNPMSFWTEQDILLYIKLNNIPICSVYGEIVEDRDGTDEVEGQLTISDIEGWEDMKLFDAKRLPLKTTGCERTGCAFCLFGLQNDGCPNRLERLGVTHPNIYEWILKPTEKGGLGIKDVIEWINEHGDLNIRL